MADGTEALTEGSSNVPRRISEVHLNVHFVADLLFENMTRFFALLVLLLLAGIMVSLFIGSLPAIKKFGLGFIVNPRWNPVTDEFGGLVPIVGTIATSAIALLIAVPVAQSRR